MKCPILYCALLIALPAFAQDASLEATEISVNDVTGEITATDDVQIDADGHRLTTQRLLLNRDKGTVVVPTPLELREADGTMIKAATARLNQNLDTGTLEKLRLKPPQGGRFSADEAHKTNAQLSMRNATFTTCPECENKPDAAPLWQVHANSIEYDRTAQDVIYKHARLELYGLPVFYVPYLAHAGPEVVRRNGFLTPSVSSNNDFGTSIDTPYFFDLAPNYDLTLAPRFSETQDVFLTSDWRHLTAYGEYNLTAYVHTPKGNLAQETMHDTRTGLVGTGDLTLSDWQLNFSVETASDDLFFKSYRLNDTNHLESRINIARSFGNHHIDIAAHKFRNTINPETSSTVDEILPSISHRYRFAEPIFGGQLALANRLTHQRRERGIDITHISNQADWTWRQTSQNGFVSTIHNRFVLDNYDYQTNDDNAETSLVANATAFTLTYPLARTTPRNHQTLTPQAQLVVTTDNEDYEIIPYINDTNIDLTSAQLFSLATPKDEASRINVGVNHELNLVTGLKTEFFIGQSYNLSNRSFSEDSGYGDDRSALLVDWGLSTGPLSLTQSTRLTQNADAILRSYTQAKLDFKKLTANKLELGVTHSFYEAGQSGSSPSEEVTSSLAWQASQYWHVKASDRQNIETGADVKRNVEFTYEDDCTIFKIAIERDYNRISNTTIEPETSFNLTFTLKTISN